MKYEVLLGDVTRVYGSFVANTTGLLFSTSQLADTLSEFEELSAEAPKINLWDFCGSIKHSRYQLDSALVWVLRVRTAFNRFSN